MAKWMIIYAFFLGFFSLALNGHAHPGKKKPEYSPGLVYQKGTVAGLNSNKENRDHSRLLTLRTRASVLLTVFPATRDNPTVLAFRPDDVICVVVAEEPRLQCNHLLHLFPSHYFW